MSWVADVTYIPTRVGWPYLVIVEDLFSRKIVGWSMDQTMESRLVVDAWGDGDRPSASGGGSQLVQSDRRSQYGSEHYQRILSEVGQRRDNTPMESFFGRLKCETSPSEMFTTRDQARAELFEHLEVFDNRVRLHSSLGF